MKKLLAFTVMILVSFMAFAQNWNNTGNNSTTGTLWIGSSSTTGDKLKVTADGTQRSVGLFGATGTGNAGIYFDASDGDFIGSDYASLLQKNDLSVVLSNSSASSIHFKTANTTRMSISGNGYVAIGDLSPLEKFQIQNSFFFHDGGHKIIGFLSRGSGNTDMDDLKYGAEIRFDPAEGNMRLATSSSLTNFPTTHFTLTKSGMIGIGTTSPSYKLDVQGDIYTTGKLRLYRQGIGATTFYLESLNNNSTINVNSTSDYLTVNVGSGAPERIRVTNGGNVGIGTTTPNNKLDVKGTIRAEEVKVESTPWPDYVFTDTYKLNTLSEVSTFISENGHLPNIPTAKEVAKNGIKLGEMNAKLLEKIEELTLYLIEMKEENEKQNKKLEALQYQNKNQNEIIKKLLNK